MKKRRAIANQNSVEVDAYFVKHFNFQANATSKEERLVLIMDQKLKQFLLTHDNTHDGNVKDQLIDFKWLLHVSSGKQVTIKKQLKSQ